MYIACVSSKVQKVQFFYFDFYFILEHTRRSEKKESFQRIKSEYKMDFFFNFGLFINALP